MSDHSEYSNPALAVDAFVTREQNGRIQILLVRRGNPPYQDYLALPGGFVDEGASPKDAVLRELGEECGLMGHNVRLADVRGEPGRDPRKHVVSIIYHVDVDEFERPLAGDDAVDAGWFEIGDIINSDEKLAFDHSEILESLLQ